MGMLRVSTMFQKPNSTIRIIAGRIGARKQARMDVPVTQPNRIIERRLAG